MLGKAAHVACVCHVCTRLCQCYFFGLFCWWPRFFLWRDTRPPLCHPLVEPEPGHLPRAAGEEPPLYHVWPARHISAQHDGFCQENRRQNQVPCCLYPGRHNTQDDEVPGLWLHESRRSRFTGSIQERESQRGKLFLASYSCLCMTDYADLAKLE